MARILIVARSFPPDARTGRAAAFARLAERLAAEHDTRWVVGWTRDRTLVPDHALGVDVRGPISGSVALWRATREVGHELRPDLVIGSGLQLPLVGWPTVAVVRDLVGTGWGVPGRLPQATRVRARALAGVVVPTQGVRRAVLRLGVDPWRIHRIPDGLVVPAEPLPPPPLDDELRLVHPGAIHPAKQQHLSIDAVSRLPPAAKSRVSLVVAGHVNDPRYLQQLRVAARGQPVSLCPDVDDLGAELRKAHLTVYPTALDEGFPDTAVEAMSLGRPVAATSRGGVLEATGGAALPIEAHDVGSLRDLILRVLAGEVDLAEHGRQAHAHALATHGWRRVWPQWRSLLTGLLRR